MIKKIKLWIQDKIGITALQNELDEHRLWISECETKSRFAVENSNEAVSIIKERTDVHVDVSYRRDKPTQAILAGKYKGRDYVRIFDIPADSMKHLLDQLVDMEKYATVSRADVMYGQGGMFMSELDQRRMERGSR